MTEQPRPRRETDDTISSQIRFRVVERNNEFEPAIVGDMYRSFNVISAPPDEAETLDYGFERILEELDNQVGIPMLYDSAAMAFPSQRHSWTLKGRDEHSRFMAMIYHLRGKSRPIWLPSFLSDFEMVADAAPGATALTVEDVGFTALGGPKESRRDIMIELLDGTRFYRRIVASTIAGGREVLGLDEAFPSGLLARDVLRISFMTLSRLDQDAIELSHKTDIDGVSTVVAAFRNAPDIRQPNSGF